MPLIALPQTNGSRCDGDCNSQLATEGGERDADPRRGAVQHRSVCLRAYRSMGEFVHFGGHQYSGSRENVSSN